MNVKSPCRAALDDDIAETVEAAAARALVFLTRDRFHDSIMEKTTIREARGARRGGFHAPTDGAHVELFSPRTLLARPS